MIWDAIAPIMTSLQYLEDISKLSLIPYATGVYCYDYLMRCKSGIIFVASCFVEWYSSVWFTSSVGLFQKPDFYGSCLYPLWGVWECWEDTRVKHYSYVIMGAMTSQITSLTTVYTGADQRKHQSSAPLAFVRGIHQWPVNSPHKGPSTRKMFQFDDVIKDHWLM